MRKKKHGAEAPKKETDLLSEKEKALFRLIKWMHYMSKSCERARKDVKNRNIRRPKYASEEVVGLYEGKMTAYKTAVERLIKDLELPELEKILGMTL